MNGKKAVYQFDKRPIVWVKLENPHDHSALPIEVPALIDTGADTSAVPAQLCPLLGHSFENGISESFASATLEELFNYWLDSYAKTHKKTWQEDIRVFQKYGGSIKNKQLTTLTKADIVKWHQSVGKKMDIIRQTEHSNLSGRSFALVMKSAIPVRTLASMYGSFRNNRVSGS